MARGLQVLGFGAISIDDIVYVDRPLSAGKGKVIGRITDHGGNVATAIVAVAKLGGGAGFIGWLRDASLDDPGAREFESHGVDISFAPRRPDARPIQSVITVGPDGDRFIAYDDEGLSRYPGMSGSARSSSRMTLLPVSYKRHRFPSQIIAHAVWL